ncbi:hypothetical protein DY000_02005779 [Brassica cretica]|uniref:Uncharacterized protein n=1 Tax=Brassica cretica TaxID=69181 RepID=A0ABQ7CFU6_BRACR|nr:hypothetical protein DY000_02005779 [Brassica cretica]
MPHVVVEVEDREKLRSGDDEPHRYDELHYHLLSSTKFFSFAVSQVRWETSTSCPQPLFHGVPRGLCGYFRLSSCLRWTVKGRRRRIRDWIAIVEP